MPRAKATSDQTLHVECQDASTFATALRIGAGHSSMDAGDGNTGIVGFVDEVFVYGTALSVDELDYLYHAAQVRREAED